MERLRKDAFRANCGSALLLQNLSFIELAMTPDCNKKYGVLINHFKV